MKKRLISMLTVVTVLCSLLCIVPASAKAVVEEFDMSTLPTLASQTLTDAQTQLTNLGITDYSFACTSDHKAFANVETKPGSVKITSKYSWDDNANNVKRFSFAAQLGEADANGTLYANKGTYVYEADLNMNIIHGEAQTSGQLAYAVFGGNKGHAMDQFLPWIVFNPESISVNTGATALSNFAYKVNEVGSFTVQVKYHIRDKEENSRISMYILEKDENGNVVKTTTLLEEVAGWLPGEKTTAAIGGAEIGLRKPRAGSYIELTGLRLYKDDLGRDIADELASLPVAEHSGWEYNSTVGAITAGLYKYAGKIDYTNTFDGKLITTPGSITVASAFNADGTPGHWLHSYTNANPKYAGVNMVLDHITNWGAEGTGAYIYETDVKPSNLLKEGTYPSLMSVNTNCALDIQYPLTSNPEQIRIYADGLKDNRTGLTKTMDLTDVDNLKIIALFTPVTNGKEARMTIYTAVDNGELELAYSKELKNASNVLLTDGATLGTIHIGLINALYNEAAGELPPSITVTGARIYEMPVKDTAKTDLGMDASDELYKLPKATVQNHTNINTNWNSTSVELPYYYEQFKGLIDFTIQQRGIITSAPGSIKLISSHKDWGDENKNPKYSNASFKLANIENWGNLNSKPYVIETEFTLRDFKADGKFPSLMDVNNNCAAYIEFENGSSDEQMRFYADGVKSNRYTEAKKYIDLSGEKNIKLYSVFTPDERYKTSRIDMYAEINGGEKIYLFGKTMSDDLDTITLGTVKLGLITAKYDSATEAAPSMEIKGVKMYEAPNTDEFTLNNLSYEKGENTLSVTGNFTKWRANKTFAPNCMIVAMYDGDKLLAVNYNLGSLTAFGYNVPATVTLDTTGIDVTGKKIRVFVWNNNDVMNPYLSGDNTALTIE